MSTFEATAQLSRHASSAVWPLLRAAFLLFATYYLSARIGFALAFDSQSTSILWPPNAILLAALLLAPARWWPALVAAAFPAHLLAQLQSEVPMAMILGWFLGNVAEALIGAWCLRRLIPGSPAIDSFRNLAVFMLCGALLAPLLSTFLDAALVKAAGWSASGYWVIWRTRFLSNMLAIVVVVPLVLSWARMKFHFSRDHEQRYVEACTLFSGLLATGLLVFNLRLPESFITPALLYLPLPFLLWAVLRFGSVGASTAFAMFAFMVIWGASKGSGPFIDGTPKNNPLSMQFFLLFLGAMLLVMTAAMQERRRAERKLLNSEERFAKVFRHIPDAMAVTRKSDGRLMEVNDRWLGMFGHRHEDVIGRTSNDLRLFSDQKAREKLRAALGDRDAANELHSEVRTRDGLLLQVAISLESVELEDEACLVTIIRDISDRRRLEEANSNLAHVSRLAVLGELTASIAHEINQPLGAILSNTDAADMLLSMEPLRREELRQILDDIRKDDLRASNVIRHMRTLMRRQEMKLQPCFINDVVEQVLHLIAADLAKRRVVVTTSLGKAWVVQGDAVHLQQVILSLVLNAVDAMADMLPPDRRIEVRTECLESGGIKVAVSDCGPGVPAEEAQKLFESFYTTKKEGMGLGLSIARSIIEAHGGRIWAENRAEGGASFIFTIPASGRQ